MFAAHVRFRAVEYLRTTWAIVPTVAFPTMIAVFFIIPNTAEQPDAAAYGLVSVLLLSFTMIAMFNFGAGTAEERALPWDGGREPCRSGPGSRSPPRWSWGSSSPWSVRCRRS